jgi:hypothetical protein
MGYNVLQSWSYHELPAVFAEAAKPLGVRVTTEEELGSAFADAAQAQRDGRCALIAVILNPAPSVPVLALRGVITLRVAGRLHHIGVGRTYTGTRVLVLVQPSTIGGTSRQSSQKELRQVSYAVDSYSGCGHFRAKK